VEDYLVQVSELWCSYFQIKLFAAHLASSRGTPVCRVTPVAEHYLRGNTSHQGVYAIWQQQWT